MAKKPKVSMVMPCWNKIKYIGHMLESVYNQTWDNIELIMVNDGATDGSREIMEHWKNKMIEEKGYEVIIIDQENQGICKAVYNGMFKITGEFFCCVDCDDELDPEYVSEMAGFLCGNSDYDWVCCDTQLYADTKNGRMFVEIKSDNRRLQNPMLCFLLEPNYRATWYLMVRTNYLRSCRVFEHYITDYKVNQEPGIFLPLAAGGGKLQYIKKILYNHNDTGRRRGGNDIDDLMPEYYSSYGPLCQAVIAKLGLPEKECDLLKEIAIIGCHAQLMTLESNASRKDRLASEFAAHVNLVLPVSEIVTEGDILRFGCELYLKTVYNYYTGGFENFGNMIKPLRRACRVIGVGALGAAAGHRLPMLIECGVTPDALWDSGAVDGSEIFGIPVVQPDYENLQRDDLVVMFSKKENTLASIIQNIKEARKQVNFFMAEDIERLYSAHLIQKN